MPIHTMADSYCDNNKYHKVLITILSLRQQYILH